MEHPTLFGTLNEGQIALQDATTLPHVVQNALHLGEFETIPGTAWCGMLIVPVGSVSPTPVQVSALL